MRTFIAIELDKKIKELLSKIQSELKSTNADVKWVTPENIHLTLKFLGEVKEEKIPRIIQSLKEACSNVKPFNIEIKNIGAFPNTKSPRVIWAGIEEGKEKLKELADLIEGSLIKLEFPEEERPFSCHITLGRVKTPENKEILCQKIGQIQFSPLSQEIKSLALFKSALTPKGPIYEKLSEEKMYLSRHTSIIL